MAVHADQLFWLLGRGGKGLPHLGHLCVARPRLLWQGRMQTFSFRRRHLHHKLILSLILQPLTLFVNQKFESIGQGITEVVHFVIGVGMFAGILKKSLYSSLVFLHVLNKLQRVLRHVLSYPRHCCLMQK